MLFYERIPKDRMEEPEPSGLDPEMSAGVDKSGLIEEEDTPRFKVELSKDLADVRKIS